MSNIGFHNECKELSMAVYGRNYGKTINGWKCIDYKEDKNGLYAETYKKNNKVVIVVRGTESGSFSDISNDVQMCQDIVPEQLKTAKEYVGNVVKKYGNSCEVSLTGHSLGGSIVQGIGTETGLETVTFSAYGVGDLHINKNYTNNITNYGSSSDPIFMHNIDNQIGNTKIFGNANIIPVTELSNENNAKFGGKKLLNTHFLENYPDLSTAKEYIPQKVNNNQSETFLIKTGIEENVYLSEEEREMLERYASENELFAPENRVFYYNEMNPAQVPNGSPENNYVQEFVKQYLDNNKSLPSEDELKQRVQSGELIYVHNYERQDGTKVSGYYRSRPNR